jgi:hypothetical protein
MTKQRIHKRISKKGKVFTAGSRAERVKAWARRIDYSKHPCHICGKPSHIQYAGQFVCNEHYNLAVNKTFQDVAQKNPSHAKVFVYSDKYQSKKDSLEDLKKWNIKLLSKQELQNLGPGDRVDCDVLLQSLLHAGYNAAYRNLWSGFSGFLASFYINGKKIGIVEGDDFGHMIKEWYLEED